VEEQAKARAKKSFIIIIIIIKNKKFKLNSSEHHLFNDEKNKTIIHLNIYNFILFEIYLFLKRMFSF